jgi:plastocyanin
MKQKMFLSVSILALTLIVAACASSPTPMVTAAPQNTLPAATDAATMAATTAPASTEAATAASGNAVAVAISGFAFNPATLTVKVGTTVTWTNQDPVVHTVTSDTGLFDSGDMAQGATFSYTFTTAGTYIYHCIPHHAKMMGTVVVTQ